MEIDVKYSQVVPPRCLQKNPLIPRKQISITLRGTPETVEDVLKTLREHFKDKEEWEEL